MEKVIIIGAGPAGLTAAYNLLKQSNEYEVELLEETNEIGGISRTVKYKENRMDIGGHRFFSKNKMVQEWWENIMPIQGEPAYDDKKLGREKTLKQGGPDPEKEDRVMLVRQRVSRIYYKKKFFDYPISMKPQTFINMGLVKTMKAGCSYLKSCVHKLPENSLENFYINRFGRVLYAMFFEGYTEKLWGRHPSEISADWGSQRVKGLSIRTIVKDMFSKIIQKDNREVETSLIEEFIYPKYGPGQLWEIVADEIKKMGGTITNGAKVSNVELSGKCISAVSYKDAKDCKVRKEADIVISSMAIKDLIASMGSTVPSKIKDIAYHLPYRDFVTIGLLIDKLNIKNTTKIKTLNDVVPDCWIYVQDTGVRLGRIQIFNNWSPYLVEDVDTKVWVGLEYFCKEGDSFWNMSDQESVALAADELVRMGIIDDRECVLDWHREKVKKAYPAYFDSYKDIDKVIEYLNQYENLYCVGRNGQHRYNNMDHSMVTSFEAVDNIVTGRKNKDNIWNVNTEQVYHEENK
ncbi:MAG TPA: hypothetical protein DCW90_14765 [Lachnospiraceae bacterium]|nr:NAD(P)/FAD-dependent oxidoreductase [uncultured Lachnoclostridium sp.]HAU86696.1 hypothetical protein [Lachnospiraceae bacterium]